jgi:hypothetical protein
MPNFVLVSAAGAMPWQMTTFIPSFKHEMPTELSLAPLMLLKMSDEATSDSPTLGSF